MNFTNDEMNLMCIYDTGSRTGLMKALSEMRKELSTDEVELRELTDSTLNKLSAMLKIIHIKFRPPWRDFRRCQNG